jgi:hypothetical protein
LSHSKGKIELEAMDDLLPVLIFLLVRSGVQNPAAKVRFLRDYYGQSMLLLNFEASVRYIALDWQA